MRALFVLLFILYSIFGFGQALSNHISYNAIATCQGPDPAKPALKDKFFYKLTIDSINGLSDDLEIVINGERIVQFHVAKTQLPFTRFVGPFSHSGVGGSFNEYVLRSLNSGAQDVLFLQEIVCGYATDNGFNRAGYYCMKDKRGMVAQAAPEAQTKSVLPEKVYVYALVDKLTKRIVDKNFSGHFSGLTDYTTYEIHAMAVTFDNSDAFVSNIAIGSVLNQNNLEICYALCGIYSGAVDCSSFDLELSKKVRGGNVYLYGDTVIFDIVVTNAGSITAYDVIVKDLVPTGLIFIPSINPQWKSDATSLARDSIAPGENYSLQIRFIISPQSGMVTIRNMAEIISAKEDPSKDNSAFDVDSTPDNTVEDEDDLDGDDIVVLENLCRETFEIAISNDLICQGAPLKISSIIQKATYPILYQWELNGVLVSTNSSVTIFPHGPTNYGEYSLTVIDANGCKSTKKLNVEPVINDKFFCISDINMAVDEQCRLIIEPSLFIQGNISAIDDYLMLITDLQGNNVDPKDLSGYPAGTVLEVKFVNPCNLQTICWSRIHLEYKFDPKLNHYKDTSYISCAFASLEVPSKIIDRYNELVDPDIWSADKFKLELEKIYCLKDWILKSSDVWISSASMCDDQIVGRIYYIQEGSKQIYLDTAFLGIRASSIDDIILPSDISNLACNQEPTDSSAFPYVQFAEKKIYWTAFTQTTSNGINRQICNVAIKYSDIRTQAGCTFGTNRILRTWSMSDWCSSQIREKVQLIYKIDDEAPKIHFSLDSINLNAAKYECSVDLDLKQYVIVTDNCDTLPTWKVTNALNVSNNVIKGLSIGHFVITVRATDKCGNQTTKNIIVKVKDHTAPVAIIKDKLSLSFADDQIAEGNFITAKSMDAGSHDFGCGPVSLAIARMTELEILQSNNGSIDLTTPLYNCLNNVEALDGNKDGKINVDEIYRDKIIFCCQDIGNEIQISVRVTDQWGNSSVVMVPILIVSKSPVKLCDDLDPCTVNDQQTGQCPCKGTPDIADIDKDGIRDCQDDKITMCLNQKTIQVTRARVDSILAIGGVGGPCQDPGLMATIAGETFTLKGEKIASVYIDNIKYAQDTTDAYGAYAFYDNIMYASYELMPSKNDDPTNGLSVLDLVLLQEIVLGIKDLEDPYLILAADVTNDGKISALDIVELRKMLLGLQTNFSNNTSWRFVLEKYYRANLTSPDRNKAINYIPSLDEDMMSENWLGIKVGDLSGDAKANKEGSKSRTSESMDLLTADQMVLKGQEVEVPIKLMDGIEIRGAQLVFKSKDMQFVGLKSGDISFKNSEFSIKGDQRNELHILWTDVTGVKSENGLFTLVLKASNNVKLSDALILMNSIERQAIITERLEEFVPVLVFGDIHRTEQSDLSIKLHQNQPNPFTQRTLIQFELPEEGEVELVFYDISGQILHSLKSKYGKGLNALYVKDEDLHFAQGIVYYQLKYKAQSITRAMISGIR